MENIPQQLLDNNRQWAEEKTRLDPEYFTKRARGRIRTTAAAWKRP